MKKTVAYALVAVLLLSVLVVGPNVGPYGVDVVSAATGETTTPTPAPKPTPAPAPKPTPAPAPAPAAPKAETTIQAAPEITRLLVEGSFGSEVELLQNALNNSGYTLKVDGFFGKKTLAAVTDYQTKNGLKADGIVGPKTLAKLNPIIAVDAVSTASIVYKEAAFEKAISKDGTWIITTLKDLTINKDLVLEGDFHDKNDPKKDLKRKIGLYTQDEKKNVTARFTLTAPKLIIKSPKATLQKGTFVGDIYVEANDFSLVDNKVVGNIYFANQKAKDTFVVDETSVITGKQVVAGVDVVTSASLVQDTAAFEKAISKDGKWIIAVLNNLTFKKALVVSGEFKNTKTPPATVRKIALYSQDEKRNVISRFTLTAPKLTIESPYANITKGTFKGDVYVSAKNFSLIDAKVDGNIYFASKEVRDTFTMDLNSSISGKIFVNNAEADAVTSATQTVVKDAAAFEKGISKDGTWIVAALNNLTFDKPLVVAGELKNTKVPPALARKIALYTQDEKRNVTGRFILTAPKLTIESPYANITKGTFKGDLYVSAENFSLIDAKVDGNVYFTTQKAKDTFTIDETSVITGKQVVVGVDAVSTASLVQTTAEFQKAISKDGKWIISVLNNLTFKKDLVLTGDFVNTKTPPVSLRKISLYSQDEKRNVISRFTLTAPKLTIESPDANISKGIFKGDVYVSAKNFKLIDAQVIGNVYFTTQEAKDTFTMDATSSITGVQELKLK